jgi:hypothetical protein
MIRNHYNGEWVCWAKPDAPKQYTTFFEKVVYGEMALMDSDFCFEVEAPELDMPGRTLTPLINPDKGGNIIFTPCTLNRELWQVQDKKVKRPKTHTYSITRWADPSQHDGKRYNFPKSELFPSQMPLIPPMTILAFEQKAKIKTLVITEGYKKAWVASVHWGWHVIGIGSITHGSDKELGGAMYADVIRIIQSCDVQRVVVLFDGDCIKCKPSSVGSEDLSFRAKRFISAIVGIKDRLSDYDVDVYYSYVNSDAADGAKGIDDLWDWANHNGKESEVLADWDKYDGKCVYLPKTNITHSTSGLKKTFMLDDVQAYYEKNKESITDKEFKFLGVSWKHDAHKNQVLRVEENEYEAVIRAYGLPHDLPNDEVVCFKTFHFYCYGNELFAKRFTKDGTTLVQISNFKLESLYLIKGVKRIFKITNSDGQSETIELRVADLQSKATLSAATTDYGNFVFWGNAMDISNLQRFLFSKETQSLEISRLGHHKDNFWAWCNGVWDYDKKTFTAVDEHGMVPAGSGDTKKWYYIPASTTNEATLDDWGSLTKFKYEESSTTFAQWAKLYYEAYGKNGMIGIAFGIMTCFRDVVMRDARCSPMLFLFGQRGSGKSELAKSLLWLFGTGQDALSLEAGTTPKSFTRLLRQKCNTTLLLDEWKNHLDKMIGPVKGIWDGYMSGRAAFSNDDRTKDATLYSTAIVAGQELPNIEPALYSRFVLLNFDKSKFGDEQTAKYRELQKMQARGLTGVTHEILKIRTAFEAKFLDVFIEANNLSKSVYRQSETIDRVLRNTDILIATIHIALEAGLVLPFSLQDFLVYTEELIPQQTNLMSTADEVRKFFGVLPTLIKNKKISQNIDYAIVGNELRLRLGQIVGEYKKEMVSQRANPLDEGTLSSYMRTHNAFIAHKTVKFGGRATTAYVFDYEIINRMYDLNLELAGADVDICDFPDENAPSQNNREQL